MIHEESEVVEGCENDVVGREGESCDSEGERSRERWGGKELKRSRGDHLEEEMDVVVEH